MDEKNGEDRFPLDDATITTIAELRDNMRVAQIAINSVLSVFARQHNLYDLLQQGKLQIADGGRELIVRRQQPAPMRPHREEAAAVRSETR